MINYKALGSRIKSARLSLNLTQEALAEKSNLSPDHISHCETANTKVSLPALVSIANTLNVSIDKLLSDTLYQSTEHLKDEVAEVFKDVTPDELYVMLQSSKSIKQAMRTRNLSKDE